MAVPVIDEFEIGEPASMPTEAGRDGMPDKRAVRIDIEQRLLEEERIELAQAVARNDQAALPPRPAMRR